MTARGPYQDPEETTTKWIAIFVILSLLAHAVIVAVILLITLHMPPPKVPEIIPSSTVTLELAPAPPPPPKPMAKPIFIPTAPQPNVPHKQQPIESANDTLLTSRAKVAQKPDSLLPEIQGQPHGDALNNSPQVQAPKPVQPSTTPPRPKQAKPTKPTPPQPKPQQGTQSPSPQPVKPPTQPPVKPAPQQPQVDPETGLPVLPALNVPTMAPPDSASAQATPTVQQIARSSRGAVSGSGDNSPAAMATDLGKYKQYVYSVIGSYWYPDVNSKFSLMSVGTVRIRATIHSDGRITDVTILDGDNLSILRDVSRHALVAPAPYKPFSDALIRQVGDSYTDEYSFTLYSNN